MPSAAAPRPRRELAEEIGVSEAAARSGLRRLFVFPYQDSSCHVWGCAFEFELAAGAVLDLQEEEVDWAGFAPMDKVRGLVAYTHTRAWPRLCCLSDGSSPCERCVPRERAPWWGAKVRGLVLHDC